MGRGGHTWLIKKKEKPVLVRQTIALRLKGSARKGHHLYMVHVETSEQLIEKEKLNILSVIREFQDVFPKEILELPPHTDTDFTIDLVLGVVPVSRAL